MSIGTTPEGTKMHSLERMYNLSFALQVASFFFSTADLVQCDCESLTAQRSLCIRNL